MKTGFAFLLLAYSVCIAGASEPGGASWKYDLRPGDHLVYRYIFERHYKSPTRETESRITFKTHVLVVGANGQTLSVGFQRNRQNAELVRYQENGKDELERETPRFLEDIRQNPPDFAEANEFSPRGDPQSYWQVSRELKSNLLMAVHEIEGLPEHVPGDEDRDWRGTNTLDIDFHRSGAEDVGANPCERVEGVGGGGKVRMNYFWCANTGVLGKITFSGEYKPDEGGTVRERMSFELLEKRRGENVAQWLESSDTGKGALQALLLSRWLPVSPEDFKTALNSPDPRVQALALACLYKRRSRYPDTQTLQSLSKSQDLEVRRIATELLHDAPPGASTGVTVDDCTLPPQTPYAEQKPDTSLRHMRAGEYQGVPYMLRVPSDYRGDRPFPLLVYLAGGGGMALDGVDSSRNAVSDSDYLVLYPQAADLWWNEGVPEKFNAVLSEVLQDLNVDTNRIYIAGNSEGGTAAILYAAIWPQRFAAVASLMGGGVCMMDVATAVPEIAHLPILLMHGDEDRRIPPHCSQDTYDAIRKLNPGRPPELHILNGREHDITLNSDGGLTMSFLGKQTREPFPRDVKALVTDSSFPRRYWIEVLEKRGGWAGVDGHISQDGTIHLTTKDVSRVRLLLRPELFVRPGPIKVEINNRPMFDGTVKHDCSMLAQSSRRYHDPVLGFTGQLDFDVHDDKGKQ